MNDDAKNAVRIQVLSEQRNQALDTCVNLIAELQEARLKIAELEKKLQDAEAPKVRGEPWPIPDADQRN